MDCLIGIIKKPEHKETKENWAFMAYSLNCEVCVKGKTKEEVAEKLADSLKFSLTEANNCLLYTSPSPRDRS